MHANCMYNDSLGGIFSYRGTIVAGVMVVTMVITTNRYCISVLAYVHNIKNYFLETVLKPFCLCLTLDLFEFDPDWIMCEMN